MFCSSFPESGHSSADHRGDTRKSAIKLTSKISSKCCCRFPASTVSVSDGYLVRLQCPTPVLFKAFVKPLIYFCADGRSGVQRSYFTLICQTNAFVTAYPFSPHGESFRLLLLIHKNCGFGSKLATVKIIIFR